MARTISGVLARQLVGKRSNPGAGLVHHLQLPFISVQTQILKTLTSIPTTPHTIPSTSKPLFNSLHSLNHRRLCSFSSAELPNVVLINSATQYYEEVEKVKDESLPAVFFFMTVTDYVSKVISKIIEELRVQFPHVKIYKIDIQQEEVKQLVYVYNLCSMPKLHFYQDGKMVSELNGYDVSCFKDTFRELKSLEAGGRKLGGAAEFSEPSDRMFTWRKCLVHGLMMMVPTMVP